MLVQIVHIEGDRKGDIDEIDNDLITFGRNPKCSVVFPANLLIVSRKHAQIKREGSQFLLKNIGSNGSYVNGAKTEETYLKMGDVITFAEGGPKVSFLFEEGKSIPKKNVSPPTKPNSTRKKNTTRRQVPRTSPDTTTETLASEFTLQYGTVIKSFRQLIVTIGKDEANDFAVAHPLVLGRHAELYYSQHDYYIRDVSNSNSTLVNGKPIYSDIKLRVDDEIGLNDNGPKFKYLGDGRLAELSSDEITDMSMSMSFNGNTRLQHKEVKPTVMDVFKSVFSK